MRFLILGGSGRTGKLAIAEALTRGHSVTALVRKSSSLEEQDGLTIVEGTPLNQSDIAKAFLAASTDPVRAVLVTLNATRETDSPFSKPVAPPTFLRDSVRNVRAVMAQQGVKRIIVMSAFGVGSSFAQLPWLMKLLFRYTNMSVQMQDHDATDREVHAAIDLDWTLIRPAMLKEGKSEIVREFGEVGKGVGMFSGIMRASVAEFMIKVVEGGMRRKEAVVITN